MKVVTKVELKFENFEKCSALLDSDCPLGQIYDFSCAFKHFVTQKMQEEQEKDSRQEEKNNAEHQ